MKLWWYSNPWFYHSEPGHPIKFKTCFHQVSENEWNLFLWPSQLSCLLLVSRIHYLWLFLTLFIMRTEHSGKRTFVMQSQGHNQEKTEVTVGNHPAMAWALSQSVILYRRPEAHTRCTRLETKLLRLAHDVASWLFNPRIKLESLC